MSQKIIISRNLISTIQNDFEISSHPIQNGKEQTRQRMANAREDIRERDHSLTVDKIIQPRWKSVWRTFKKLKINLP